MRAPKRFLRDTFVTPQTVVQCIFKDHALIVTLVQLRISSRGYEVKVFAAILVVIFGGVGWMLYRVGTADERDVRQAAANVLKDPESAEYRNIRRVDRSSMICGEVNAKNAFGAYTGFKPFVVNGSGAKLNFSVDDPSDPLDHRLFQTLSRGC